MFQCFRMILAFFSLAVLVLTAFALTGSYEAKSYLTNTYLIDFQLNHLDLSKLIDLNKISNSINKRELITPTKSLEKRDGSASDILNAVSSFAGSVSSDVTGDLNDILKLSYKDLGLADVYSVSFWGYCKGYVESEKKDYKNKFLKEFDNSKLNITWCTKPKAGYEFDPLAVFKSEVGKAINGTVDGNINQPDLSGTIKSTLSSLIENLSYSDFDLPGNLNKELKLLNNLTKAGFALLLVAIVLAFISLVFQVLGCCIAPNNCCLSILNFFLQSVVFIAAIVGSGLVTGAYMYTRKAVNNEVNKYGVKSYLSKNFYAFAWSGVVAAFLLIVFSLFGHCCGCFGLNRRRFRAYQPVTGPPPPPMAYSHEGSFEK